MGSPDSRPSATVELRPVVDSDLPVLFDQQADPVASEMARFPARDWESFSAHWAKTRADATVLWRAVLADGILAGNIVSFDYDGRREVGYWIGQAHWGRGIASAALAAFLSVEPTRPLYAGVVPSNLGSQRVLAKAGFVPCAEHNNLIEFVIGLA